VPDTVLRRVTYQLLLLCLRIVTARIMAPVQKLSGLLKVVYYIDVDADA
jgi:hypothetical protein